MYPSSTEATLSLRRVLIGAMLLIGCCVYLVSEAITAAAWHDPPYSYMQNYISDLGVVAGSGMHRSPRAEVFNMGILLAESMMIAATFLLAPLMKRTAWRRAMVAFAIVHCLGSDIVALVPYTPGTSDSAHHLHVIAAYMAIAGGNLGICALGFGALRDRAPAWFALPVALGVGGFAGAVALLTVKGHFAGLFERMAVDSITCGEMAVGAMLLAAKIALIRGSADSGAFSKQVLRSRPCGRI